MKVRHYWLIAALVLPSFLWAIDSMPAGAPPLDISTNGHLIDSLFNYTTMWNIFYFTLVCIGLFGFSYLYHHKRHPKPYYTYGNKKNHHIVTLIIGAGVFLSIDAAITYQSTDDLHKEFWNFPKADEDVLRIEVLAQQWMWNFRYAGKDGVFNTADDILLNHDLHIPKGRKVEVRVTSKDVIHSFYLPNFRQKVDAIPGKITRMWFQAREDAPTGNYDIACAEMCGTHHYLMKARLVVHEPEDFDRWLENAQGYSLAENDLDNLDNFWGWKWETE